MVWDLQCDCQCTTPEIWWLSVYQTYDLPRIWRLLMYQTWDLVIDFCCLVKKFVGVFFLQALWFAMPIIVHTTCHWHVADWYLIWVTRNIACSGQSKMWEAIKAGSSRTMMEINAILVAHINNRHWSTNLFLGLPRWNLYNLLLDIC